MQGTWLLLDDRQLGLSSG